MPGPPTWAAPQGPARVESDGLRKRSPVLVRTPRRPRGFHAALFLCRASSAVRERDQEPRRARVAHPGQTYGIEEDHSRRTRRVHRLDKQRADQSLRAATLMDDRRPEGVAPGGQRPFKEPEEGEG